MRCQTNDDLPITTLTSVLNISTYINTRIKVHPVGPAVILVIMSVSTYITDIILCILTVYFKESSVVSLFFIVISPVFSSTPK